MIAFEIFGDPIPWARPGFFHKGKKLVGYDTQAKLKEGYKWQMKSQFRDAPLNGPLLVDISFFMPIPKATSGIKRKQMVNGIIYHIKKPDVDNLTKFVLDCLNGLIIVDDSQVTEIRAKKIYSAQPGTSIRIHPLGSLHESINVKN